MKPTYEEMESVHISCKSDAQKYIGKNIWYLRSIDIDKSGRGYYFPRFIAIIGIEGKEFYDEQGNSIPYKDILRIKILN